MNVKSLSRVWLLATSWTAAYQVLCPWDFPGKSTGVGCHCLLSIYVYVYMYVCVYIYIYVCVCVYIYMCVCIYICVCVCVYVCVCIYICVCVCIYIYIYIYKIYKIMSFCWYLNSSPTSQGPSSFPLHVCISLLRQWRVRLSLPQVPKRSQFHDTTWLPLSFYTGSNCHWGLTSLDYLLF